LQVKQKKVLLQHPIFCFNCNRDKMLLKQCRIHLYVVVTHIEEARVCG
jgi:hypothetical protein